MKRRTLDIVFSVGALAIAGLLAILGFVMADNADFSRGYVRDQLAEQKLTFKPADELTPAEEAWTNDRSGCLYTFAGEDVTTGKHAECWANEYVGGHLRDPNRIANANGKTYSELGTVQGDIRAQIATAKTDNPDAVAGLEKQLADVTAARETVFKGEMLRGALLTTYGFSVLGEKAGDAATVAYAAAILLALLGLAGLAHALLTPATRTVGDHNGLTSKAHPHPTPA